MSRSSGMSVRERLLLSAAMSALLWVTAEAVVARLFAADLVAWSSPPKSPDVGVPVLHGNPYLLFELVPGVTVERGTKVHINSLGLRGREVDIPKPAGRRRFLTTGDSSVYGFGVEDGEVFSSVAERLLGDPVEAVSGAVGGYSSLQSLNLLRMRALRTEPDLVVIGNLWSDNNFGNFVDKERLARTVAYDRGLTGRAMRLLGRSAIFRVLDWRLRVREHTQGPEIVDWVRSSALKCSPRRVSIDDYAANLDEMVELAGSRGAEVVFLMLANRDDLDPTKGPPPGFRAWDPYRDAMRDTARRHGAAVIEVPSLFIASGRSPDELFLDEMHPTALGHGLIGEALAGLLAERGWPQGGRVTMDGTDDARPDWTDPWAPETCNPPSRGPDRR